MLKNDLWQTYANGAVRERLPVEEKATAPAQETDFKMSVTGQLIWLTVVKMDKNCQPENENAGQIFMKKIGMFHAE